ncbi:hypothetical protein MBUL_02952 [Methylobacterium bullatum]|uniref:Uncharacterized protein n=1 Tax=Methylobacterium bullatum TaxID=570505 RepID=A0A679IW77_9HYPH|nr:hypothetical protein MBUL_02952 [Methylobacterium bullatum]
MTVPLSRLRELRDDLIRARTNPVREFEDSNGERVVYRSDAELAQAIIQVNREIQTLERPSPTAIMFRTSKGL